MSEEKRSLNFIEQIIEEDLANGMPKENLRFRFPPEPNGYLHIGHTKAIGISFGLGERYNAPVNLRFDDTNPAKEEQEYVDAIKEDISWLGYQWENELYSSDYFQQLYDWAVLMIKEGKAFVDSQSSEDMAKQKGTPTEPGTNSPFRDRSVQENLALFEGMKNGDFKEGEHILRAKIDMTSPNMLMRDPIMYRILYKEHHRTGNDWNIYPMYDWTHGESDYLEQISHSLCSLEFKPHRDLYNWFLNRIIESSNKTFKLIDKIKGIGSGAALELVSKLSVNQILKAIKYKDASALRKVYSIGPKKATKIINSRDLQDLVNPSFSNLNTINQNLKPKQREFSRLNLSYTIMSKRKLMRLVEKGAVSGWDDPRMPTISGLRRRGYTPASIRNFIETVGVSKRENVIDVALLEFKIREDLNKTANRVMGVLDPVKVVITNYPEGESETLIAENNPEDEHSGSREVPFSREIYIEKEDFREEANKKFFRLKLGKEVRLKNAYIIKAESCTKDEDGNITEIQCTYDPLSRSGSGTEESKRKVKGTLHWVSVDHAVKAEVRSYDRLFSDEAPDSHKDKDFMDFLNPNSLEIINAYVEPSLQSAKVGDRFQFQRLGYFAVDNDSTSEALVFNKTVGLRDNWSKKQ